MARFKRGARNITIAGAAACRAAEAAAQGLQAIASAEAELVARLEESDASLHVDLTIGVSNADDINVEDGSLDLLSDVHFFLAPNHPPSLFPLLSCSLLSLSWGVCVQGALFSRFVAVEPAASYKLTNAHVLTVRASSTEACDTLTQALNAAAAAYAPPEAGTVLVRCPSCHNHNP